MHVKLYEIKNLVLPCHECDAKIERQVQKGVDIGIVTLLLKLASTDQYDRIILSAGDGDYEEAVAFVKQQLKKEFWLCGFEDNLSADLQCFADQVIWIDELWDSVRR